MTEQKYYKSVYTGEQIDQSLGRILDGEVDQAVIDAQEAAKAAQTAQKAIEDMAVDAQTLDPEALAQVSKTEENGVVKLTFGLPRGKQGERGPRGPQGDPGVSMEAGGFYGMYVNQDGNLILSYTDETPPPLSLDESGNLIYTVSDKTSVDLGHVKGDVGPQGPVGPPGPKGETGTGLDIKGTYESVEALKAAVSDPKQGDMYNVGTEAPYTIYMWDTTDSPPLWKALGQLQGAKGEKGDPGEPGPPGVAGKDGPEGPAGKSAYQAAKEKGYTGTEEEFNAALATMNNAPFLPLSGGTMTGDIKVPEGHSIATIRPNGESYIELYEDRLRFVNGLGGVYLYDESEDEQTPVLAFLGEHGDEATILRYIANPVNELDAANKRYVDTQARVVLDLGDTLTETDLRFIEEAKNGTRPLFGVTRDAFNTTLWELKSVRLENGAYHAYFTSVDPLGEDDGNPMYSRVGMPTTRVYTFAPGGTESQPVQTLAIPQTADYIYLTGASAPGYDGRTVEEAIGELASKSSGSITRRLPVAEGYSVKAGDVVDVGGAPSSEKAAVGSRTEGSIVYLNEGGKPVEFYVAKHDYESGLNGAGRTLVVRKDIYDLRQWHNSNVNAYATSDIDSWLNGSYKGLLDLDVQSAIGTTKFPYTPGNGNWAVGTLARAIFLLSLAELGKSRTYSNTEGSKLPIADTLIVASFEGHPTDQWTRSMSTDNTSNAHILLGRGIADGEGCSGSCGSRPVFTLPADFEVLVPSDVIAKNIEPQANVETTFSDSAISFTTTCSLNTQTSILAYIQSSTAFIRVRLQSGELGSVFGIDNSENIASLSLARINDNQIMVGFVASGTLRTKIATVKGTGFSYGAKRTAINSNLTEGLLIALSETKVLAIANRNGIDARVCTISGTEIDDDTGANHATVPGVTSASNISATLLPDDESGNKRVCVCFADGADGSKGKAVIATIDRSNQVTWGDVVTWMDTLGSVESLSCCFDGDYVIVAAGNWVTVRAISIEPKLSVAGKPVNASHTSVSPQSALVHANGKSILLYNDRPSGGRKEGTRACIIHNQSGDLSFGPEFIFANNSIRGLSAGWASDSHVLAAYADGGNSNCGTCTILTVEGDQIAGSFLNKSSQAIALQDGNAGDLIDIIYSGTAELPMAQGTRIESSGVQGYAPMEGLLEVFPWYLPGVKIATGSYKGTGVSGSGNKNTIVSPGRPVAVMICSTNINQRAIFGGFTWVNGATSGPSFVYATSSSTKSACVTLEWNENSVSWYGDGPNEQLNNANFTFYYVILYK